VQNLQYTPLEKLTVIRPVDRIKYIQRICAGKTVLDLGAMDETAFESKRGNQTWLHEEIARVAKTVVGVDNSSVVPELGLRTSDRSMIHRGDVLDLEDFLRKNAVDPEVIVAGELIEHVANPLEFLRAIAANASLRGKTLLLSTPNATALHNCLIGMTKRESTHHDHLLILSYKTLNTLFLRSGCSKWEILPYYARFTEMKERTQGAGRLFVAACESAINAAETLWPLLSFGLIGHATL
jgi:2-polyprenyl-3-methyl-5-hydroxy-6-metoxy-1,4-benzoquinol methylase